MPQLGIVQGHPSVVFSFPRGQQTRSGPLSSTLLHRLQLGGVSADERLNRRESLFHSSSHELDDMLSNVLDVLVVGQIGDVQPQISDYCVDRKATGILG